MQYLSTCDSCVRAFSLHRANFIDQTERILDMTTLSLSLSLSLALPPSLSLSLSLSLLSSLPPQVENLLHYCPPVAGGRRAEGGGEEEPSCVINDRGVAAVVALGRLAVLSKLQVWCSGPSLLFPPLGMHVCAL